MANIHAIGYVDGGFQSPGEADVFIVKGDLQVDGSQLIVSTEDLSIQDKTLRMGVPGGFVSSSYVASASNNTVTVSFNAMDPNFSVGEYVVLAGDDVINHGVYEITAVDTSSDPKTFTFAHAISSDIQASDNKSVNHSTLKATSSTAAGSGLVLSSASTTDISWLYNATNGWTSSAGVNATGYKVSGTALASSHLSDGTTLQPKPSEGAFENGDKTKLDGIAAGAQVNVATNLSQTTGASDLTIASSTGTNITIAEASGTIAGLMTTAHHDKLDGIASGAEVNRTAAATKTLIGTDNSSGAALVPSEGSSGQFLQHDNTFGTPAYATKESLDVDHLITLTGMAATSEHFGTDFTGTTIADSSTIKSALQALETAVEAGGSQASFTATSGQFINSAIDAGENVVLGDLLCVEVNGTAEVLMKADKTDAMKDHVIGISLGTATAAVVAVNSSIEIEVKSVPATGQDNHEINFQVDRDGDGGGVQSFSIVFRNAEGYNDNSDSTFQDLGSGEFGAQINCKSGKDDDLTKIRDRIKGLLDNIDTDNDWAAATAFDVGSNKATKLVAAANGNAFNFSNVNDNSGVTVISNTIVAVGAQSSIAAAAAQKVSMALPGSLISGVDTNLSEGSETSSVGDALYLGANGAFLITPPSVGDGHASVRVGIITKVHDSTGSFLFQPQFLSIV